MALTTDFQDGVSPTGWTGASDTTLHEDAPDTNFGANTDVRADGDQPQGSGLDVAVLLGWDVSLIPPDATVTEVSTSVNITAEVIGATYEMYELRRAWVEAEATWRRATASTPWEQPGALGPTDRGTEVLGVFNGQALGRHVVRWTDAGVALVQAWVKDGGGNFGVIIHDTTHTNGQSFSSREAGPADRPILGVWFELPAAGVDAGVDAGSDVGLAERRLNVGCGCGSTNAGGLGLALLLAARRRKHRA